ncbi:LysM peptidoglycan-binding domain-containing protein [Symbiobacterium terraclitae]|uniref:LysM peptidoglycan-binding domain-containing protein n=1 Tax=Symbiobacterium terraclitae TaxID=557451 RepID=UPI0035B4FF34
MAQCPPGSFAYRVRPGDDFWRLAQRFGTTPAAIARANPGVSSWGLRIGQPLCIPGRTPWTPPRQPCPWGWEPYQIQPGDTLGPIAWTRRTSVANLLRVNRVDPNNLRIGQIICVPRA